MATAISTETGVDVEGYNLALGENEIRKINKDHGNELTEAPRGQRAVTETDYLNIPNVVQSPDSIKLSPKLYEGKPVIEFRKTNGNETTVVSAVVSDKRLDLFVQTTFVNKKRGSIATPESEQADSNTPEATGGTAPNDAPLGGVQPVVSNSSHGASSDAFNNSIPKTDPGVNTNSDQAAQPSIYDKVMETIALGRGKDTVQTVDTETQAEYDNDTDTITDDEKAALLAYKSGGSYQLNARLRDGIELDEQQQAIVDGLDSALPKLPVYTGTVYRNLVFDDFGGEEARTSFIDAHAIGDVVTYDAFTSTSSQIDGYPVEGDFPIHIEIRSTNGRNLEGFGNNFESEVLFRRKSKYIVENIVFGADGTPTVYLTEVSYGKQETKAETADRGRTQGDVSRDHSGESRSSAETETSQVQRLPAQTSGDSNVQNLPGDNSRENFGRRNEVRGVQPEVGSKESVGAAPAWFDVNTRLQYEHGNKPDRTGTVRDINVPNKDSQGNRVSDYAANIYGNDKGTVLLSHSFLTFYCCLDTLGGQGDGFVVPSGTDE